MLTIPEECKGFKADILPAEVEAQLKELARQARGDILKMTTLAGCGHPGGSMSSIDIYTTLFQLANVDPARPDAPGRDRIVISHGHTSPGVYSALAGAGFFPREEAVAHFRQALSPYEGHVEHSVPGVEWSTGNLGQGLSVGCGLAAAGRVLGLDNQVFVVMGDGEQQKGQISEARRFAVKYGLAGLTCVIDRNHLQISGSTDIIMPQRILENFIADSWRVMEINGHDFAQIYSAFREAITDREHPVAIIARTVMGKGVRFMENDEKWHGQALPLEKCQEALAELGVPDDLAQLREQRNKGTAHLVVRHRPRLAVRLEQGTPRLYPLDKPTDNRSAWGGALEDLARSNTGNPQTTPLVVFDCDLASSVKTGGFAKIAPDRFFQSGIMEHHTAAAAGAMSTQGIQTFWADFGVFGIDEVYNQQRLNDINEANLKVVCTHVGTDVGEDGKTHHCVDYLGLLRNLYGFRVIIPADPNQTDRVVRWVATQPGNYFIGMGRSKNPVITQTDGAPVFGESYAFEYGRADLLREGRRACIATMGIMAHRAVQAADELAAAGIDVAVVNIACPKDPDLEALQSAWDSGLLITYEDHNVNTGLGAALAQKMAAAGRRARMVMLGLRRYVTSGTTEDILRLEGLGREELTQAVCSLVKG